MHRSCHCYSIISLRWRHNDHAGVSNHQPHGRLLNRLFRLKSKKTSKLRVTGLCAGNSPGTGEFSAQMASYAEIVSIWWRHHVYIIQTIISYGTNKAVKPNLIFYIYGMDGTLSRMLMSVGAALSYDYMLIIRYYHSPSTCNTHIRNAWTRRHMGTFSALLALCREIHRWPHKGQWRGALIFSLICACTNGWVNNRDAGDLRRHCARGCVTVMDYENDNFLPNYWFTL